MRIKFFIGFLTFFFQVASFSQIQLGPITITPANSGSGSGTSGSSSSGGPIISCTLEELRRQEAEYRDFLNAREARYQEILSRIENLPKAQIDVSKILDESHRVPSTEASNEQVDRILAKLEKKNLKELVTNFQVNREYNFSTPLCTEEGEKLNSILEHRNQVAATLSPSDERYKDKIYLVDATDRSLSLADTYYQQGAKELGEIASKAAVALLDIVSNFIPGVSWGRDLYEAMTGKDLIYGTKLSTLERSLAIVGASTIGIGSKLGKGMKIVSEIATSKAVQNAGKYKEAFDKAERVVKSAEKFDVPVEKLRSYAVDLASPKRRDHILNGELLSNGKWGGGHMHPGKPGKTVYPQSWSGDKIMHETADIVTDPMISWERLTGVTGDYTKSGKPARFKATGTRDGVTIEVVVEPAGEGIITAYPKSGAGVLINPEG